MESTYSNEAMEIANACLRLRGGLNFELHQYNGKPCYVVQDETSSGFYQLGIAEYAFVSLLDGRTSIQQAVQETSRRLGEDAFTIRDAIGTCQWLLQNRLATTVDGSNSVRSNVSHLIEQRHENQNARTISQVNPLFVKLPLGDPARLINRAAQLFGWITSKAFFTIWMVVMIAATVCLFEQSSRLTSASVAVFTADAWAWLLLTFVGMKLIHELAHGIFCHQLGGRVSETGFVFILFIPIPYVDVTSCWGFPSKWKRIAVSAAGMYIELFMAGVATIAWSLSSDPVTRFHLFNVMLTGSLTTILFNANFLMRFDGYYILSDLIEVPNLAQSGQQFLHFVGKRYLLGMDVQPGRYSTFEGFAVRAYGIAAFAWRIFICVSLSILATALLYGFGMALAILGILMWVGMPLWRLAKLMLGHSSAAPPDFRRLAFVTAPLIAVAILSLFLIPWPFQVSAPAIVQYHGESIVRADVAGFIQEVHVDAGAIVRKGDVLFELENSQLAAQLTQLEADREISVVRSRRHHNDRSVSSWQSELGFRHSIEQKLNELRDRLDNLKVRAKRDGQIVGTELSSLPGRYVDRGQELAKVVDVSNKEIAIAVGQRDFQPFADSVEHTARFSNATGQLVSYGKLISVEPTASESTDGRLTSAAGGPLAVLPSSESPDDGSQSSSMQLVYPHFKGIVQLPTDSADALKPGMIGTVTLARYPASIATHVLYETRQWLTRTWNAAHQ
jgi:putative peptide zinc metalloprotease protein